MVTEIINGKEVKCKLTISSGMIHFENHLELGVQIFPNEEKLKVNFNKKPIFSEKDHKLFTKDEIEFNKSYWIEKKIYDQILPAIEEIGCIKIKDDLMAYMQHAKRMLSVNFIPEDGQELYKDNVKLKEFFENLSDIDFEILNFKMTCIKNGVAKTYKIENPWFIDRFREKLLKWKNDNDDYDDLIGNGIGLVYTGFNYKLFLKQQRYSTYKVVLDYFYINTDYKSVNDICKKTGVLFAALNDLPSAEYFKKKIEPNLKYNNYHEYLGDRVFKIIKRPV